MWWNAQVLSGRSNKAIKSHRNREKTKNKLNFLLYFGKIQVDYRKMPVIRLFLSRNFLHHGWKGAEDMPREGGTWRSTECQTRK